MKKKNSGIVLKSYLPNKCKLVVLDSTLGKIVAVPGRTDISAGALINYYTAQQTHIYFISSINIIDMPFVLAKDDILFMHHVLELCYYFTPMAMVTDRLFVLLLLVYMPEQRLSSSVMKKVFLFQLLSILGLYPEDPKFQSPYFHHLASTSIDIIAKQPIDLIIEKDLDAWLRECIALHPCANNFKTVNFLLTQ